MIGVRADEAAFRIAVAELPASARLVDDAEGAIVVVTGTADPGSASTPAVMVLADPPLPVNAPPPGIPIVVDRARLRPDVVADAGAHPDAVLLTAECTAPHDLVGAGVRDAVGWLRALAGEDLEVDAVRATDDGIIALLRAGQRPATLVVTVLADPSRPARLRALAVGAERTEVVVRDAEAASVVRSGEGGSLALSTRYESRRRLALRRAIDAIATRETADLDELRHDERIAGAILDTYKPYLFKA